MNEVALPIFGLSNPKAEHINSELHRKLKSGKKYEGLIPYSDCSSVKLADGDTKVAIDNMAIWSKKYQHHTAKLSKLFAKYPLPIMCEKLHTFLYEHFQYKIDGINQNLRSPACSWKSRTDGIDCKSYSIFASTVLLNLGVTHYLRRIKQGVEYGFSHVYVIVPKNQKTNDLKQGYFTIDGTLQQNAEPLFYEKDDILMQSDIPAYGLANPIAPQGLGWVNTALVAVKMIMNVVISVMSSCAEHEFAGNMASQLQTNLAPKITRLLHNLVTAIQYKNAPRIRHLFNELLKELDLGYIHLISVAGSFSADRCVSNNFMNAVKYVTEIKKVVDTYLDNFVKSYGDAYGIEVMYKDGRTDDRDFYFGVKTTYKPINAQYRYLVFMNKTNRYAVVPIWGFEVNEHKWLIENKQYLKNTYGDGRELLFEKEVAPVMDEIRSLRAKYYLGGGSLYYFEQPLQRKMYKIWLKYDDKYVNFLKKEAQSLRTANEIAFLDFKKRFQREIDENERIKGMLKQRINLKKGIGYGVMTLAGGLIIKTQKNE